MRQLILIRSMRQSNQMRHLEIEIEKYKLKIEIILFQHYFLLSYRNHHFDDIHFFTKIFGKFYHYLVGTVSMYVLENLILGCMAISSSIQISKQS